MILIKKYNANQHVGIKDKETGKIMAVYPHEVQENTKEFQNKVLDWYYKQGCSTSEYIENYYVDTVTEEQFKAFQ